MQLDMTILCLWLNVKLGKKIWDRLSITYEGICTIKNSRLNIPLHNNEIFYMHPHKTIFDMFRHFY